MHKTPQGAIPERPNRPLVVRCGYEGSSRRVNFPSAATCRLESLRSRVGECFSLSAAPFSLIYADDDGEEFTIRDEDDFTEAIAYFISGDDDAALSSYSGSGNGTLPYSISATKITLRLDVIIEYDGPSLSDTSSVSSFATGSSAEREAGRRGSFASSFEGSHWNGRRDIVHETIDEGNADYDDEGESTATRSMVDPLRALYIDDDPPSPEPQHSPLPGSATPRRRSDRSRAASTIGSGSAYRPASPAPQVMPPPPPPLTGPESDAAPSLLTHSDLGTRWLREQSRLAGRKLGSAPKVPRSRRYDSDEESFASDDERAGEFALVRDARGRYYYSYQTDSSSQSSRSEADFADHDAISHRLSTQSSSSSSSTTSPPITPNLTSSPSPRSIEPANPPILAPDCSACGIRLDYMRYVCQTCGEGEMWKENAPGKTAFVPTRVPSDSSHSDGSSDATEWAVRAGRTSSSSGSATVYNTAGRSRSGSISTNASLGSLRALSGSSTSPTSDTYHYGLGLTPPHSPTSARTEISLSIARGDPLRHAGYELCVGCIEVHGIQHSKAAAKAARHDLSGAELRRRRKAGELRHTFREKIWGPEGWDDVEYNENSECTICQSLLFHSRFKCVSCPKFDLCRSCYQKVDEIHPAHAFLSLPDKPLPQAGPSRNEVSGREIGHDITTPQPIRHPDAFCHNCLQDIIGPRFHCAVCPSWDLCIQCEGIHMSGGDGSGHLANHIMMKIPVPLPSQEVEAASRRARDRWFLQDRTVAAAGIEPDGRSTSTRSSRSRSSSPSGDADTVYAPTATARAGGPSPVPPSQIINITMRDALDHGVRCGSCNEWIMGRRYQCANCPSDPVGYNLCSICELRSYKVHNPTHVFFKFDRPVHIPLRSRRPLLPPLYRHPVGKVHSSALATINPRDPTAYLKHVLHRETLCDVHGDQVQGVWLRCAHCAAGFDICQKAEGVANHDPTHVFVMFKARVDMAAFRALADLAATHSKPLLRQQVYVQ